MVNEEIVGGLKAALERGESLKRAMNTFFNAKYNKKEIEEAAASLSEFVPETAVQPKSVSAPVPFGIPKEAQAAVQESPFPASQLAQKVSEYGEEKKGGKLIVFVLIALLVFLSGALTAVFLFRDQLINFFSTLLG